MGIKQYNYKTINCSCRKLCDQIDSERYVLDYDFQRGLSWNVKQKSLLIHSLIIDIPIQNFCAVQNDKTYHFIDAKQRGTAIYEYINNNYALSGCPPVVYDDGSEVDINGKKYKDLPEDIKSSINEHMISIIVIDTDDPGMISEMFYRWNNGTPLKSFEKNISKSASTSEIRELSKHPLFTAILTVGAKKKLAQRGIVIQSLIMMLDDEPSFDSKKIAEFLRDTEVNDADVIRLNDIYDKMLSISKEIVELDGYTEPVLKRTVRHFLAKGNIPIMVPFIEECGEEENIAEFLADFFTGENNTISRNHEYNQMCMAGSGHNANIMRRLEILKKEYKKF